MMVTENIKLIQKQNLHRLLAPFAHDRNKQNVGLAFASLRWCCESRKQKFELLDRFQIIDSIDYCIPTIDGLQIVDTNIDSENIGDYSSKTYQQIRLALSFTAALFANLGDDAGRIVHRHALVTKLSNYATLNLFVQHNSEKEKSQYEIENEQNEEKYNQENKYEKILNLSSSQSQQKEFNTDDSNLRQNTLQLLPPTSIEKNQIVDEALHVLCNLFCSVSLREKRELIQMEVFVNALVCEFGNVDVGRASVMHRMSILCKIFNNLDSFVKDQKKIKIQRLMINRKQQQHSHQKELEREQERIYNIEQAENNFIIQNIPNQFQQTNFIQETPFNMDYSNSSQFPSFLPSQFILPIDILNQNSLLNPFIIQPIQPSLCLNLPILLPPFIPQQQFSQTNILQNNSNNELKYNFVRNCNIKQENNEQKCQENILCRNEEIEKEFDKDEERQYEDTENESKQNETLAEEIKRTIMKKLEKHGFFEDFEKMRSHSQESIRKKAEELSKFFPC